MNYFSTEKTFYIANDKYIDFNESDFKRFVSRIDFTPTCWFWTCKPDNGYGRFWLNRKSQLAHRIAYLIWHGEIPKEKQLDHLCRNRNCINPAHLEPVSIKENVLRGEGITAQNARKTHCKMNHELTQSNLYSSKRGSRVCAKCQLIRLNKWRSGEHND